jgi:hypothetical protein
MSMMRVVAVGVVGLGLLVGACGRNDEPPQALNRVLGGTPVGAPITGTAPDRGILEDPATYQGAAGGTGVFAAADAESATRELMDKLLEALLNRRPLEIVDAIDPAHAGPLADDEVQSALLNTASKLEVLLDLWKTRIAEQEAADVRDIWNRMMTRLAKQELLNLFNYDVLDADHVKVKVDRTRAEAMVKDVLGLAGLPAELTAGVAPLGVDAPDAAAGPGAELELLVAARVNGTWMAQPPPMPADAVTLVEGMRVVQEVLDRLYEVVRDADLPTLNSPALLAVAAQQHMADLFGAVPDDTAPPGDTTAPAPDGETTVPVTPLEEGAAPPDVTPDAPMDDGTENPDDGDGG